MPFRVKEQKSPGEILRWFSGKFYQVVDQNWEKYLSLLYGTLPYVNVNWYVNIKKMNFCSKYRIYYSLCNIKQFGVYITFLACTHVAEEALLAQLPKTAKLVDDRHIGHVFDKILKNVKTLTFSYILLKAQLKSEV